MPNVPSHIIDILDQAVADMLVDPVFLEEFEMSSEGGIVLKGKDLRDGVAALAVDPEVIAWIKDMYSTKHDVGF